MKRCGTFTLLLLTLCASSHLMAQNTSPTTTKRYDVKDFDKIRIEGLNGGGTVALGEPFGVAATGSGTALAQINVTRSGDTLVIRKKENDSDWKSGSSVTVRVMMPKISNLYNNSNADVSIGKFEGTYCGVENNGNGNVSILGSEVGILEIENNGNGNVEARGIPAKKATVSTSGNGDVSVNTDEVFGVRMIGNGNVVNYGKGKANVGKQVGNGRVVYID